MGSSDAIPRVATTTGNIEMKITEAYARLIARHTYFWAWPMVNLLNRRITIAKVPEPGLMNGVLPVAPLNMLSMLHDYVEPNERWVACPNQDVVYGGSVIALEQSPVIVQVPDFGDRFWVYQIVDLRTDSFAQLGGMYGSEPGFYMLVGPDWHGEPPQGIRRVFRAKSNTGMVVPRVFQDDTPEDRAAIQDVINQIDIYPLERFDGAIKRREWSKLPKFMPEEDDSSAETKWVFPETFFDQLPQALADAPARTGEESLYEEALRIVKAGQADPSLMQALIDEAAKAERELKERTDQFRNWGISLANHWTKADNGATFGRDYFARTAIAKSNILVNAPNETQYLYLDLDADGSRLNGAKAYEVIFPSAALPPVDGFWSLTLYDEEHFFVPNAMSRYSLGTKNTGLKLGVDGSLVIRVQAQSPGIDRESNWLPAPANANFSLYLRGYWPKPEMIDGRWTPPAVRPIA